MSDSDKKQTTLKGKTDKLAVPSVSRDVMGVFDIFKQDIEVRRDEIVARREDIATNKEIQIIALEHADKENERNYKVFIKSHDEIAKDNKFKRNVGYICLLGVFAILAVGFVMSWKGNPLGNYIITSALSIIIGAIGGWGLAQNREE